MTITDEITTYNLDHFAKFEVGSPSEIGIYPVLAFYPNSDQHETLYANTDKRNCQLFIERLSTMLNAKSVFDLLNGI